MKCIHCPVPAGDPCRNDLFPFFCAWAASGNAARRAHVVNRSAIAEGKGPDGPVASSVIPPAESMRRLKLARACPHRTGPRCGCAGWATCLLGKGKGGQVALGDCVACVSGRD